MALVFSVGHTGDPSTSGTSEWFSVSSAARAVSPDASMGPYSAYVSSPSSGVAKRVGQQFISAIVSADTYYTRFPLYIVEAPNATSTIVLCGTSSSSTTITSRLNLRLLSTGAVHLFVGNTSVAASSALATNTVHWIEYSWHRNTGSADGTVALRINGVAIGSVSNATIIDAMVALMMGANLASDTASSGEWYLGFVQINDSTGGSLNSWPSASGAVRAGYLRPNGTGTHNEPTASGTGSPATNWEATNEVDPDLDVSYASMGTASANWSSAGSRLMMACEAASAAGIGASDTVLAVAVGVVWSCASSGSTTVQPGMRSSATTADVGTAQAINQTTDAFLDDANVTAKYSWQVLDPGGNAWTPTLINALEIGARATDATPAARVTAVWAMVLFVPAAAAQAPGLPILAQLFVEGF